MFPFQDEYVSLKVHDNVAVVKINNPNEKVNSLSQELNTAIKGHFERLLTDPSITAGVVISGKPDNFIAGADIGMLEKCQTAEEATNLAHGNSQRLNNRDTQ